MKINNNMSNARNMIIESVSKDYSKRIAELNWVLEKYFENPNKKSGNKVKNWLGSHTEIPASKIPDHLIALVNKFDRYNDIEKRRFV